MIDPASRESRKDRVTGHMGAPGRAVTRTTLRRTVAAQRKFGIVLNGPDCTLGDFSLGRVQRVINQTRPCRSIRRTDSTRSHWI